MAYYNYKQYKKYMTVYLCQGIIKIDMNMYILNTF